MSLQLTFTASHSSRVYVVGPPFAIYNGCSSQRWKCPTARSIMQSGRTRSYDSVGVGRERVRRAWPLSRFIQNSNQRIAASAAEIHPPPIDKDLHEIMRDMGAEFSEDGVVKTFGFDDKAIAAATNDVVVVEMSHFGRLRVTGEDRIRFLHNQSTADFLSLKEGQGCDTVFVTPTARTIDLSTAWKTAVSLFVSPNTRQSLLNMLNRYIFFSDKVEVTDITNETYFFAILGPRSDEIIKKLELGAIIGKPYGTHLHYAVHDTPVTVGVGGGLAGKGYSLMLSTATAGLVWEAIIDAGAVPMGDTGWERLRILQGRPAAGKELTDEFNVLEAGLWNTISTSKGCYIGQETVARLITYNGVKQQLWGVELERAVEPGTILTVDGTKVGKLTSYTKGCGSSKHFGLAYIRRQAGGAGLEVDANGVAGRVVEVPFLKNSLSD
ncbi:hypothetical protein O6H91_08G104800 [Diphasiastrum complanatum]|uniref:Uncharacterized protein n=1 Tax=Diphasiastrum complanatum TaxID=34168 RepID=A0ACC2D0Z3_DIPCM|nr:hypothetical protein O6H91_08G104800 [Diphasiastrum complanatum]